MHSSARFTPPGGFGHRFGPASVVTFPSLQVPTNNGIPPLSAIPPLGVNMLGTSFSTGGFSFFSPFFGYPLVPVIDGYGYGGGSNIIVLQPIQMPYAQPRKPEVAHASSHDYPQPAESANAPAAQFTLAMTDGSNRSAILVWVEEGKLRYIDPTGRTVEVPLRSLDRATTERLNREKNLELHLPTIA